MSKILSKQEMLKALAEVCVVNKIRLFYDDRDFIFDEILKELYTCENLTQDIECIKGESENYTVSIIKNKKTPEEGPMVLIFKIEDKKGNIGYLRFKGLYSSWGSSMYISCDVVGAIFVNKVVYLNAIERSEYLNNINNI